VSQRSSPTKKKRERPGHPLKSLLGGGGGDGVCVRSMKKEKKRSTKLSNREKEKKKEGGGTTNYTNEKSFREERKVDKLRTIEGKKGRYACTQIFAEKKEEQGNGIFGPGPRLRKQNIKKKTNAIEKKKKKEKKCLHSPMTPGEKRAYTLDADDFRREEAAEKGWSRAGGERGRGKRKGLPDDAILRSLGVLASQAAKEKKKRALSRMLNWGEREKEDGKLHKFIQKKRKKGS